MTVANLIAKKKPVPAAAIAAALKVDPKVARARLRRNGRKNRKNLVAVKDIKKIAAIIAGKQ